MGKCLLYLYFGFAVFMQICPSAGGSSETLGCRIPRKGGPKWKNVFLSKTLFTASSYQKEEKEESSPPLFRVLEKLGSWREKTTIFLPTLCISKISKRSSHFKTQKCSPYLNGVNCIMKNVLRTVVSWATCHHGCQNTPHPKSPQFYKGRIRGEREGESLFCPPLSTTRVLFFLSFFSSSAEPLCSNSSL